VSLQSVGLENMRNSLDEGVEPELDWEVLYISAAKQGKSLTTTHVRGLYREKLDAGLAPRTVQYIHTTLHKVLKDAIAEGLILRNVAKSIKAPRPRKQEINPSQPIKPTASYLPPVGALPFTLIHERRRTRIL
jgi:hypothetical protein